MKVYAKIDAEGNVIEFPYRELTKPALQGRNSEVPEDAVEVDTTSRKPTGLKWYQGIWYDQVEREGDSYVLEYTVAEKKWSTPEEKKNTLATLIRMAKTKIDTLTDKEAKEANLAVLETINVNDETTYDNYHNLTV